LIAISSAVDEIRAITLADRQRPPAAVTPRRHNAISTTLAVNLPCRPCPRNHRTLPCRLFRRRAFDAEQPVVKKQTDIITFQLDLTHWAAWKHPCPQPADAVLDTQGALTNFIDADRTFMDKLGTHSLAGLTKFAIREGVTPLEE
jgi:hypothetical protein